MSITKASIEFYEQHGVQQMSQPGHAYLYPIKGDTITLDIPDGDVWEGFWIGATNISDKDSMFDYDVGIVQSGQDRKLVAGQDYQYRMNGFSILFDTPIVGPAQFLLVKKLSPDAPLPQIRCILLPRQQGLHVFSEQVLQDLVADAVGKEHPLKNLIADNDEYLKHYTRAAVLEAEVTEKGIEALVELRF